MFFQEEVANLLTRYNSLKKEIAVLKEVGGRYEEQEADLKFLDFCLSLFQPYQRELLSSICIHGISIREYADATGLSRNYISKEKQRLIEELARYYEIRNAC